MSEERRQHPRFPFRSEAEVKFTSWQVFRLIYTVNISRGGMNLELPEQPALGTLLKIKLVLPSGKPIRLDAVVRFVAPIRDPGKGPARGPCQVGVEFQDLDAEARKVIEDLIAAHQASG